MALRISVSDDIPNLMSIGGVQTVDPLGFFTEFSGPPRKSRGIQFTLSA